MFGHRRSADHHPNLLPHASGAKRFDGFTHSRHRHGQQRGERDDIGLIGTNRFYEGLRRYVGSKIVDFKAAAFEHRGDQVLPDIVEIARDRSNDHFRHGLRAARGKKRPQDPKRALHRPPGEQQLGHEIVFAFKAAADFVHRRNHAGGNQLNG